MKKTYRLIHAEARNNAIQAIQGAPTGHVVQISEPTRTLEQNGRLWASLNEISKQVEWHGRWLTPEEWKHIFSSAIKKQTAVPNLDGSGFVVLGQSTSRMTKQEMSDLLMLIESFAAEHCVKFSA